MRRLRGQQFGGHLPEAWRAPQVVQSELDAASRSNHSGGELLRVRSRVTPVTTSDDQRRTIFRLDGRVRAPHCCARTYSSHLSSPCVS